MATATAAPAAQPGGTTHPMEPVGRALLGALLVLTFATGLVDAASVLGLGHVFTANMTGNLVLLGFALGGRYEVSITASLLAIVGFLAGAGLGGRLVRTDARRGFGRALALESTLFAAATVISTFAGDHAGTQRVLLLLLSAGMGLQNAAVRRLAVADLTTTVLTLTLTGLAADLSLAGSAPSRTARRVGAILLMLAGATAGAALLSVGLAAPIGAAFLAVTAAAVVDRTERKPRD